MVGTKRVARMGRGGALPFMILQNIQDATEAMARERETWMKVIMSLLRAG